MSEQLEAAVAGLAGLGENLLAQFDGNVERARTAGKQYVITGDAVIDIFLALHPEVTAEAEAAGGADEGTTDPAPVDPPADPAGGGTDPAGN